MLDLLVKRNNTWTPPEPDEKSVNDLLMKERKRQYDIRGYERDEFNSYLLIKRTEPYIDSFYVQTDEKHEIKTIKRFVFHEGHFWSIEDENFFTEHCSNKIYLNVSSNVMDDIYRYYNSLHPEWQLKPYFPKQGPLFDHIHHCQMKHTAKELLYKAGLNELAAVFDEIDEYDMLATSLKDIYEGLSVRTLRALNCRTGAKLVSDHDMRVFLKGIQDHFSDAFKDSLSDACCGYLSWLKKRGMTCEEAGRLLLISKNRLQQMQSPYCYRDFLKIEQRKLDMKKLAEKLGNIDRIYTDYLKDRSVYDKNEDMLKHLLLEKRSEYDRRIRASNRKRNDDWQERNRGYVIRFPQTVNDLCREAVYNRNCLLGYIEAVIENETTVLFMRNTDNVNKPFITLEVCNNELVQARHKKNAGCTREESAWIREYCDRHGIDHEKWSA